MVAIGNLAVVIMAEAGVVGTCAVVIAMSLKKRRRKRERKQRIRSTWAKEWLHLQLLLINLPVAFKAAVNSALLCFVGHDRSRTSK